MSVPETESIWMNGKLVPWKEANVHVLSHALHYGSGVFEGIRCYKTPGGSAIFRYKEHMERLYQSAAFYFMDIPYPVAELMAQGAELIRHNKLEECYIRPLVFRGYGRMGVNPLHNPIDVTLAVWPWGAYLGDEALENGIRVCISNFHRGNSNIMPTFAKATGQYLNSILGKIHALKNGFDEAIMLDGHGHVSEGSGENLFIVRDGVLHTPPDTASILPGITRDTVITMARDMGFEVLERTITRSNLYSADEVFFTGTAAEVTPIREIDNYHIGKPGEVTRRIQDAYFKIVKGHDDRYAHWLYKV